MHHELRELLEEWRENARAFASDGKLEAAGAIHACADQLEGAIDDE
jgi:hypothetical protein